MDEMAGRDLGEHPLAEAVRYLRGLDVGERVEVATRFTGTWSHGFVVARVEDRGYHLRRLSDGHVLPVVFSADELRLERRSVETSRPTSPTRQTPTAPPTDAWATEVAS